MKRQENERRSRYFENVKGRFNRCLAPGMTCNKEAIGAHSVQNSKVLGLLALDGHVKAFRVTPNWDTGPRISIDDVSRNHATTFTGLCSRHDTDIFRPIDTEAFDSSNREHLFLYAYRSGLRELHAVMEGAAKVQSGYHARVEMGMDDPHEVSPAGMMGVVHMMKAYQTYAYMTNFDRCYLAKQWDWLVHDVRVIEHAEPTIAVSSLFSVDDVIHDDEVVRICINVFPLSAHQSVALFSYSPEDAGLARSFLQPILTSTSYSQKYLLSKLILNNCENLVISPTYFSHWSTEKRDAIERYFLQTIFSGNLAVDNEHLYLF